MTSSQPSLAPHEFARHLRCPRGAEGVSIGESMNRANHTLYDLVFAHLDLPDNVRVLEIGFGNGRHFPRYFEACATTHLTGLELSETMCEVARGEHKDLLATGRLSIVEGNCLETPFPDDSFDRIVTLNCIYFWRPLTETLRELRRILAPNGLLVVGTRPSEQMQKSPFIDDGFRLFSAAEVVEALEGAGFRLVDQRIVEANRIGLDGTASRTIDICTVAAKSDGR